MRESLCNVSYSGYLNSSYIEEEFEGVSVLSFTIQLKITPLKKAYKPIYKIIAFKGGQFENTICNKILPENIGKRLEVSGMEVCTGEYPNIIILQRLIYDDYLLSLKEVEKMRQNTPDLSEDDDLFNEG